MATSTASRSSGWALVPWLALVAGPAAMAACATPSSPASGPGLQQSVVRTHLPGCWYTFEYPEDWYCEGDGEVAVQNADASGSEYEGYPLARTGLYCGAGLCDSLDCEGGWGEATITRTTSVGRAPATEHLPPLEEDELSVSMARFYDIPGASTLPWTPAQVRSYVTAAADTNEAEDLMAQLEDITASISPIENYVSLDDWLVG
jgi:hypothetical protein